MSDPLMPVEILERIHEFSVRGANDELTEEHWAEFEQLLRENDDACRMYGQYVDVSGLLPAILSSLSAETAPSTDVAFPEPLEPARSPALPLLGTFWHGAIGFFSQEIPFALLVGTVITSLGLWAGSMVYVTHSRQLASDTPRLIPSVGSDRKVVPSDIEFVGRVTGMVDVRWDDINTSTEQGNRVPLGRKYALASGLMEISYHTGAKVILQGPCTYEANSPDGGFLSVGKLTAKLEKKGSGFRGQGSGEVASGQWLVASKEDSGGRDQGAEKVVSGQWSVVSKDSSGDRVQDINQKSEIRNQKFSVPSFAVRTPTAVVTDLGTEFGVEVDKRGRTDTQVFAGVVKIASINDQGNETAQSQILHAGQYASVETNRAISTGERNFETLGKRFLRTLPKPQDAGLSYANLVLSMNPVVYYRMDQWPTVEGKNHYILVDSAPGSHHGVAVIDETFGKPSAKGKFGGAMDFHGAGAAEHAFVSDYPKTESNKLSVSAWVRPLSLEPWTAIVGNSLSHFESTVQLGQFGIGIGEFFELVASIRQQDGQQVRISEFGKPLARNVWNHVALVADGTVLHLYRNGEDVAAAPYRDIDRQAIYRQLNIGCRQQKASKDAPIKNVYYWNGWIDEVAVFNHALSPEQVWQLYKSQTTK